MTLIGVFVYLYFSIISLSLLSLAPVSASTWVEEMEHVGENEGRGREGGREGGRRGRWREGREGVWKW